MSQDKKKIFVYDEATKKEMEVDVSRIVTFQARTIKRKSLLVAFMDDGNQYIML